MSEYLKPLSPSSINLFRECSYKFYLKYIRGIKFESGEAANFGKCIHKILENFWVEYSICKDIDKAIQISSDKHWDKNIGEEYNIPAHECLNNAISIIKERPMILPLYIEYSCLNTDNNTIAIIDLVMSNQIIDYKTGKNFTKNPKEPNIIQAVMCSMNLEKVSGKRIRDVEFEYIKFKKYQQIEITDTLINEIENIIIDIREKIERGEFPKNEKNCFFCDYKLICEVEKRLIKKRMKNV